MPRSSTGSSNGFKTKVTKLDRDMTVRDIIEALERLIFCNDLLLLRIDGDVRDYLVSALRKKI